MLDLIERIFGVYGNSLALEGKRYLEIKGLVAALAVMKGFRRVALALYLGILATVVSTAGLMIMVLHGLTQYEITGSLFLDTVHGIGGFMFLIGMSSVLWALQERRWMNAFRLSERVEALQSLRRESQVPVAPPSQNSLSQAEIEKILDDYFEKKMRSVAKEDNVAPLRPTGAA
jgi:hypothetical protein